MKRRKKEAEPRTVFRVFQAFRPILPSGARVRMSNTAREAEVSAHLTEIEVAKLLTWFFKEECDLAKIVGDSTEIHIDRVYAILEKFFSFGIMNTFGMMVESLKGDRKIFSRREIAGLLASFFEGEMTRISKRERTADRVSESNRNWKILINSMPKSR